MKFAKPLVPYPPDTLLTVEQVAAYLGISKRQLRRLPIPYVTLSPRHVRYLFKQVLAWLESRAA